MEATEPTETTKPAVDATYTPPVDASSSQPPSPAEPLQTEEATDRRVGFAAAERPEEATRASLKLSVRRAVLKHQDPPTRKRNASVLHALVGEATRTVSQVTQASAAQDIARRMVNRDISQIKILRSCNPVASNIAESVAGSARGGSVMGSMRGRRSRDSAGQKSPRSPQQAQGAEGRPTSEEEPDTVDVVKSKAKCLILPFSGRVTVWKNCLVVAVIADAVATPYMVAFGDRHEGRCHSGCTDFGMPWWGLLLSDAFFAVDMLLKFLTAFVDPVHNSIIVSRRAIARRYLTTTFALDAIALVPLWRVNYHLQLLKLVRLHYLTRFGQDLPITSKYYDVYSLLGKVVIFSVLLHVTACAWQLVMLNAGTLHASQSLGSSRYTFALYTSFALLLGDAALGLDGSSPAKDSQLVFSFLLMLVGAVMTAVLFGAVALALANSHMSRLRFNEHMKVVNEKMQFYRLPDKLKARVRARYEYAWKQYRDLQSDEFLYTLTPSLKQELAIQLYAEMLRDVNLFQDRPEATYVTAPSRERHVRTPRVTAAQDCSDEVISALSARLRPQFYLETDVLCREGCLGHEMFFLKCGVVALTQRTRGVLAYLDSGHYFGEMALLSSKAFGSRRFALDRRTCTVTAHTICDVVVLTKLDLEDVVGEYPVLLGHMLAVANKRLAELGELARVTSCARAAKLSIVTATTGRSWLNKSFKPFGAAVPPQNKVQPWPTQAAGGGPPLELAGRSSELAARASLTECDTGAGSLEPRLADADADADTSAAAAAAAAAATAAAAAAAVGSDMAQPVAHELLSAVSALAAEVGEMRVQLAQLLHRTET